MSGRALHHERQAPSATWVLALAGSAALLLRPRLLELESGRRTTLLVLLYLAILASSLLVPAMRERAHLHPAPVLLLGAVGVYIASFVTGRVVSAPLGLTALPLSTFAAVAEEALFRRAGYGWLERFGVPVAIFGSALGFAFVHIPLYGVATFPVDLGAGLLFSWQRWASGDWTVPAVTHAAANVMAVVLR